MRLIIIAQSIIILLGGYYIYILAQERNTVPKAEIPVLNIPDGKIPPPSNRDGYTPPTENPPPYVDLSATGTIKGSNDAGMEYPTPDTQVQL